MSRSEFEYDICQRDCDGAWQVVAKLSSVRLGETSRENVKDNVSTESGIAICDVEPDLCVSQINTRCKQPLNKRIPHL